MRISSVTCAYNEEKTIFEVVRRLTDIDILDEIVVVDNGSLDSTYKKIIEAKEKHDSSNRVKVLKVEKNIGLGFGLKKAIKESTGDIVIRQDADLEYEPYEIPKVLEPILKGDADASYGSRLLVGQAHRVHYYYHYLGNLVITHLMNFITKKHFSDVATATKAVKGDLLRSMPLTNNGFHIDWEITLILNQWKASFYEVPITYHGRKFEEGKKVKFYDGIVAIFYIIYRFYSLKFSLKTI